jgi:CheY-like chemotaxis protein
VEDEPTHMKLAHVVLETAGFNVAEVKSAEAALAAIAQDPPEVILLDLKLPGMNGVELARRLKQDPATASIPIVAVTAYAEQYSRADALQAGFDAYLQKPLDTHTLADRVTATVQKPG